MNSTRRFFVVGAVAATLGLGLPAAASAIVYCVPNDTIDGSCTTGQGQATIQAALTAAQSSTTVADTVLIDQGMYSEADLSYSSGNVANVVTVIGDSFGPTVLTLPSTVGGKTGLTLFAPPGSSVQDLAMTIPANADATSDRGIQLFGGAGTENVLVDGPAATNATGIQHQSTGTVDDSTVDLPYGSPTNTAISTVSGNLGKITNSVLHADTGVTHSGSGTTTVQRTAIQAKLSGIQLDQGTLNIRNTLIDLDNQNNAKGVIAANFNNGNVPIVANIEGSTIVNGGTNSTGVQSQADSDTTVPIDGTDMVTDNESSTVTVSNTIIYDVTVPLRIEADRGETASVTTSYSNYNTIPTVITSDLTPGGGVGTATLNESNRTNFNPLFVNEAMSDYHLTSASALIDIGDPTDPPMGELDIDGDAREIFGKDNCEGARRDIGADEFVPGMTPTLLDCLAPETSIASGPPAATSDNTPSFGFTSNEAPVTFQCSTDGGVFAACPAAYTSPVLADGAHTLAVKAIDASLNEDATPATSSFTVDTVGPNTTASGPGKLKLKKKKKKTAKATYSLASTEAGSSLECSLDGGAFAACSPSHSVALKKGTHTLSVRSTDAAGNVDTSPATVTTRVVKKKKKKKK